MAVPPYQWTQADSDTYAASVTYASIAADATAHPGVSAVRGAGRITAGANASSARIHGRRISDGVWEYLPNGDLAFTPADVSDGTGDLAVEPGRYNAFGWQATLGATTTINLVISFKVEANV